MVTKPRIINDPIQAVDEAYAQGIDTWEAMVAIGASDEEDMTERRWRQGDLALRVERRYGDSSLAKFAYAIGANTSTLKQRGEMSDYYQKDTRVSFPQCGYSHYREAKRLKNIDLSMRVLDKASLREWPVWKLGAFVNRLLCKPAQVQSLTGTVVSQIPELDEYVIKVDKDSKSHLLAIGQQVTVKAKN